MAYLGYALFETAQAFRLTRWLYAQVTTSTVRPGVLFDLTAAAQQRRMMDAPKYKLNDYGL